VILCRAEKATPTNVHIYGSITGSVTNGDPLIEVGTKTLGGGLNGTIAINGSFGNAILGGPEIVTQLIHHDERGAIAIDYDGWQFGDDWASGATIEEWDGMFPLRSYGLNDPDINVLNFGVFDILPCRGDMDHNNVLNSTDVAAWNLWIASPTNDFVDSYAGLEGSAPYHADVNCDMTVTSADVTLLESLIQFGITCCMEDCIVIDRCRADFDQNGAVGTPDLSALLQAYGRCYPDRLYLAQADFDFSGCVDLSDQALFLSVYGYPCPCFGSGFAGPQGDGGAGDPEFVEWVRQATIEELLAWYQDWCGEQP
jgi:hypothetical protein